MPFGRNSDYSAQNIENSTTKSQGSQGEGFGKTCCVFFATLSLDSALALILLAVSGPERSSLWTIGPFDLMKNLLNFENISTG